MDNKENELFNGIIDIPTDDTNNVDYSQSNYVEPSLQQNLQTSNSTMYQPMNDSMEVIDVSMDVNENHLQPEIIDVQPSFEVPMVDLSQDLQSSNDLNDTDQNIETNSVSAESLEIIDFGFDTTAEQINEQGKPVNHELLKNLTQDTNNLVNPDMIVNPFGKQNEPVSTVNVEEPKVDYDEIKAKKGYVFMAIIFLIIIVFIIFLPQIKSLLGI